MKIFRFSVYLILILSAISGCTGKGSSEKGPGSIPADTVAVPDTGYTGIKQYFSGQNLIKEVTFKNGVRQGLMKSFYQTGQVYQTFWYENGLREDSVKWYFLEGQLFRSTPYKHDTIDGIQKQYYRTGKTRALIGYEKGLRTEFFAEYTQDGRKITSYPEIVTSINDEYSTRGYYRIGLELSDKSTKVKFYRGDFTDGRLDTSKIDILKTTEGKATLNLKKTGTTRTDYVGVIAEIITTFGNRYFAYKKIDLPYNDLN